MSRPDGIGVGGAARDGDAGCAGETRLVVERARWVEWAQPGVASLH